MLNIILHVPVFYVYVYKSVSFWLYFVSRNVYDLDQIMLNKSMLCTGKQCQEFVKRLSLFLILIFNQLLIVDKTVATTFYHVTNIELYTLTYSIILS